MTYEPPPNGFRTFIIVWITQSISVFGTALTFFSVNIWLTQTLYSLPEQKPQLAFALSAISLAFALPVVFGAPLAGAWVDRHDRKRTMLTMDYLSGTLSLVLMALMLSGNLQFWMLILLIVGFASAGAFHNAAFDTSYAMIVPEKQLPRANGMMQTIWSLSGILSPMIAATLIALPALAQQAGLTTGIGGVIAGLENGTPLAIFIDAITFFIAATTLIFLYIPSPVRTDLGEKGGKPKKSIRADVREGALYIWHRRPLLWLLGTFAVANFVSGPMGVFQPLIVKFNLAPDWTARGFTFETALALLATLGAVGGVVGGVFISAWGGLKKRRVLGVVIPLIISGISLMLFGLSTTLYLTAAMVLVETAMIPIMNSHSQTIWQTQTPRELQGRVFSVRRLIAQFTWPLSTVLAGWLGGLFNPGHVMAVLGLILTVFCIGQLFNPYLMQVEDKEYLERLAAAQSAD
ncbi:MAG: Major Facilitator Superfamily transporter [Chloroflexi bacterium]|nr:Major Facilitator Superfamily transporter [Chloroflexota bacterium]